MQVGWRSKKKSYKTERDRSGNNNNKKKKKSGNGRGSTTKQASCSEHNQKSGQGISPNAVYA
jgi:hypothetical protein